MTIAQRFWQNVAIQGQQECWPWMAGKNGDGYGYLYIGERKSRPAHRVSYELTFGPIPAGLHIDHLCRNHACVNPAHLEPVTCRENIMRSPIARAAVNAAKATCEQGHPLSGDNLRVAGGKRCCRTCARLRKREYEARLLSDPALRADLTERSMARGACVHGHPLIAANAVLRREGGVTCRECRRRRSRDHMRRVRAAARAERGAA